MTGMKGISGEAHYFEESFSFEKIRRYLDSTKPGTAGTAEKLEAMKSLLAMISKGQDVSGVFAEVVKNVIVTSVELKKLVYIYLVHYADANVQCRELALLSINSFQKDLADTNQLIRALALRVMTSIRVADIIQIQLIAIRKCATDSSPYVRKCAANAISKIYALDPSVEQQELLGDMIGKLLLDPSTMVCGSAVQAFNEVCPDKLSLLHPCFRRLCHLLSDLDEWGQTVTVLVLMRYTRDQFINPIASMLTPLNESNMVKDGKNGKKQKKKTTKPSFPQRPKKKNAFYSDDDDDNDDDNEDDDELGNSGKEDNKTLMTGTGAPSPFYLGGAKGAKKLPLKSSISSSNMLPSHGSVFGGSGLASGIGGGEELDEDHRLLLRCSLPLLKSRNSAVVMAVATLHYYCGNTQSVATSALIGKSLVRIMRNLREVQFVVLSVISVMASTRADMFAPFLTSFFVRATDAAYLRSLKLDILACLVNESNVTCILLEFQAYVRHIDQRFVCETIRALARVADALPQVSDRCCRGLMRLIQHGNEDIVAESVVVLRQLLHGNPFNESKSDLVRDLAAMLPRIQAPLARASIVWILGEFQHVAPDLVCDALRLLTPTFADESTQVKMQIINLGVKLVLEQPERAGTTSLPLLLQYIIELAKYDLNYDLRDRARMIRVLLASKTLRKNITSSNSSNNNSSSNSSSSNNNNSNSTSSMALNSSLPALDPRKILLGSKPPPLISSRSSQKNQLTLGSLSDMVNHFVAGYQDLKDWPVTQPNPLVRRGEGEGGVVSMSDDVHDETNGNRKSGSSRDYALENEAYREEQRLKQQHKRQGSVSHLAATMNQTGSKQGTQTNRMQDFYGDEDEDDKSLSEESSESEYESSDGPSHSHSNSSSSCSSSEEDSSEDASSEGEDESSAEEESEDRKGEKESESGSSDENDDSENDDNSRSLSSQEEEVEVKVKVKVKDQKKRGKDNAKAKSGLAKSNLKNAHRSDPYDAFDFLSGSTSNLSLS